MGRGAWRSTVYGVTLSRTRLKRLSMHDWVTAGPWETQGGQAFVPSRERGKQSCRHLPKKQ